MGNIGIFVILQYALIVSAVLFFFELFWRAVKALEIIAKSYEIQNSSKDSKE